MVQNQSVLGVMHAIHEFRQNVTHQLVRLEEELTAHVTPVRFEKKDSRRPLTPHGDEKYSNGVLTPQASNGVITPTGNHACYEQGCEPRREHDSERKDKLPRVLPTTPKGTNTAPRGVAWCSLPCTSLTSQPSDCHEVSEEPEEVNKAVELWQELVETFLMQSSLKNLEGDQSDNLQSLRKAWIVDSSEKPAARRSNISKVSVNHAISEADLAALQTEFSGKTVAQNDPGKEWPFVRHPDKTFNMFYMLFGSALVMYDFTAFPTILAFDLKDTDVTKAISWLATIYWTVDIAMSCCVGYYTKYGVELRLGRIIRNYARTWMAFDVTIVTLEWALFVFALLQEQATDYGGIAGILRFNRYIRVARFFRCVRVVRIGKLVSDMMAKAYEGEMSSELTHVVARLMLLIFTMLLVSHYVACGWFAIAYWNHDDKRTWLNVRPEYSEGVGIWYAMSYHWSITQFTPATNDIAPQNLRERIFACTVVLFALVMFSNFLSSLTNALAEIRKINYSKYQEEALIKDFLHTRNVSVIVRNRTWHFYKKHYKMRKPRRHECDIPFIRDLPRSIKSDLYKEIYAPALVSYTIFEHIGRADWLLLLGVCTHALAEKSYISGQEIFSAGEVANSMLFCFAGRLSYRCDAYYLGPDMLQAPCHICETTLWCQILHLGLLMAESSCETLLINGHGFAEVCSNNLHSEPELLRRMQRYAALYVQFVIDQIEAEDPLNDVNPKHGYELQNLVDRCFQERFIRQESPGSDDGSSSFWKVSLNVGQLIANKSE